MVSRMKLGWVKYGDGHYVYGDKDYLYYKKFTMWFGQVERGRDSRPGWYARRIINDSRFPETECFSGFQSARNWVVEGVKRYLSQRSEEGK